MPEILIRAATARDFNAVASLLAELGRDALTPESERAIKLGYEKYIKRPDTAPLVAELDGQVVGFLSLEYRQRLNRAAPQAWIPDLIVTEPKRGQGVGKALLLRAFELAREQKCWSVTLESGTHRTTAHQLYKSEGMEEVGSYFLM